MSKGNYAMLVLVAGLGTFYYVHDIKGKEEREKAETQQKRLFPAIEKPDVTEVKIERLKAGAGAQPWVHDIALEHGIWVLQGNQKEVLRTSSIGQAVKSLVELQRADVISDSPTPANRGEFGMDKPTFRITLIDKKNQNYSLLFGDKTPDDNGYYVAPSDKAPIATVNTTLPELLDSNVDAARETSPVVFEPSTINKLKLEPANGSTVEVALAEPREHSADEASDDGMEITDLNEKWQVTEPEKGPADWAKIRDYLWNWRNLKVGRFLQPGEKPDFTHPVLRLTAYVDGQKDPFVIEVGSAVPGKSGMYYARRMPPEEAVVLEFSDPKLLEPGLQTVQQRHFAVFQPEDATRVEGSIDGMKISATKSDEQWQVSQPKPTNPKVGPDQLAAAAGDLVWELKNAEWAEKLPANDAPKNWKQRGTLQVFGSSGSLGKLELGPPTADGKGAYVKDEKGNLYRMAADPYSRWHDIKERLEGKVVATPTPTPAAPGFTFPPQHQH